jgi:hypothetical protein
LNVIIQQERIASTKENPELGHMILNHLCPAIITLVTDDINQSVRSLFGKVKNTPWRLVEELVEQGGMFGLSICKTNGVPGVE